MVQILRHELKKQGNETVLFLYLDQSNTEFARELGSLDDNTKGDLDKSVNSYIRSKLPNLKQATVKIMVGGLLVTSFAFSPAVGGLFGGDDNRAHAAEVEVEYKGFADVSPDRESAPAIEALVKAGVIKGYPDGFHPREEISRQHAAVMFVRALKLPTDNVTDPGFKDVPTSHPYYKEIAAATAAGFFNKGETFNPTNNFTRGQSASVIVRAYDLKGDTKTPFKDLAGSGHEEAIGIMYNLGLAKGTGDTFKPGNNVTREQFAMLLHRTIEADKTPPVVEVVAPVIESVTASNLKEVVVTFNKDIDPAHAGTYTFPATTGLKTEVAKVDGNKVTVRVTEGTVAQQSRADLTIDGVKAKDGTAVAKDVKSVEFFDVTAPTVAGINVTAPGVITVSFSEPLKTAPNFKVDDGMISVSNPILSKDGRSVTLNLGTAAEGAHKLAISGGEDFAGYSFDKAERDFTYAKDVTAPTFKVQSVNESRVVLEFDEAITNDVENDNVGFYHTHSGASAYLAKKTLSEDGKTLTLDFDAPLPPGNVNLFLKYTSDTGAKIQDAWGNKMEGTTFNANVVVDTTAPTVIKVEPKATASTTAIEVTFSEEVDGATSKANYTLIDADGKAVAISDVNLVSGNTYRVTTSPLNGGNYTLSVKNLKDRSMMKNTMADYTTTVAISDLIAPTIVDLDSKTEGTQAQLLSEKIVRISFSEAMDASTITNKNNYMINGSALDKNVTVRAVDNNRAVVLDFTNVTGDEGKVGSKKITVGRLADTSGNFTAGFEKDVLVPGEVSAPLFDRAEVTAEKTIKFYFGEVINGLAAGDFQIKVGDEEVYTPASAISVSTVDGKTVVTATTAQTLPTDGKGILVKTADTVSGKNAYDTPIQIAENTTTADKYGPVARTATASEDANGNVNQITLTYSEDIYVPSVQDADFTVEGYDVKGVSVTGKTVTIDVKAKDTVVPSKTPKVTQVGDIQDIGRNVIATQEITVTVPTPPAATNNQ
jgi:trimeric autotransporter adhesin